MNPLAEAYWHDVEKRRQRGLFWRTVLVGILIAGFFIVPLIGSIG